MTNCEVDTTLSQEPTWKQYGGKVVSKFSQLGTVFDLNGKPLIFKMILKLGAVLEAEWTFFYCLTTHLFLSKSLADLTNVPSHSASCVCTCGTGFEFRKFRKDLSTVLSPLLSYYYLNTSVALLPQLLISIIIILVN